MASLVSFADPAPGPGSLKQAAFFGTYQLSQCYRKSYLGRYRKFSTSIRSLRVVGDLSRVARPADT